MQKVYRYIELYQIGDKDGVGEVELCYVVHPKTSTVNRKCSTRGKFRAWHIAASLN